MRKTGHYETLGDIKYFIPDALPPQDPPLQLNDMILDLYGQAMHQLGKLNEMIEVVPDVRRFIKAYVVKEALLSSSIEGIHTTMLDVFTQPLLEVRPEKNTQLVMNYTRALYQAIAMLQEGLPLSNRVILQAHKILMEVGEGEKSNPGHYRTSNVKVGNLVPAPANKISELMADLERFIHVQDGLPELIKAGLAHVQFETIHPFMDGNGRIGRMLIVLMLYGNNLLAEPILYPSYYFKKHHLEYYQKLDNVRVKGDFEGWVAFYLTAIRDSALDAYSRAKDIENLYKELLKQVTESSKTQKSAQAMSAALNILFSFPVVSIKELSEQMDVAYNTAHKIIIEFCNLSILSEETEQKRGKLYRFKPYLDILNRDYID